MASVVVFLPQYIFSHELRLTTFSLLAFTLETDHLLLGSKLTVDAFCRYMCGDIEK